ncbi:hypothetical protein ASE74_14815 [Pedobacter sp. Leaf216]|uniref:hypothetical protein n=1 Tax=Pedobacter sp. Leaf216 TaxID=1735684 RepID=UPI000700B2B0|nr:hypothetical protein [Pedobacter sp. Leaf216]KQM78303.1 hypothetical protein ASE74_14815 [Pedobacter sp. Leaf216]
MKKILKTIGFGIVIGAAAFFIPFVFKFIFAAMLIGLIFRVIIGRRRHHFHHRFNGFEQYYNPIVPIDNQWYRPNVQGNGTVNNINVNY